ncbi:hypothetical protein CROQUDRAFT_96949 [Cronartium quercuum f. sp. fusiforme G11]|uniref:Uncharacterized protein n=1 Tax=Cronartium quercuum f. sp. fusiforme G11 TaxID=708437 RepID=A0A9P6T8F3_9BASI|nr:hypothetical protein CROQUDRAFT_96949 [Cronartium quercuum f. sp. fusiforme G11]
MSVRPGPDQARACVAESGSGSRLLVESGTVPEIGGNGFQVFLGLENQKVVDLTVVMF